MSILKRLMTMVVDPLPDKSPNKLLEKPDVRFEGLTAAELTKVMKSATAAIKSSTSEVQTLKKENEELRQRLYDLEHQLGLKKGYR